MKTKKKTPTAASSRVYNPKKAHKKREKVCIIIPAFNEQESIGGVIREIQKVSSQWHIVVVNDGSSDATSQEVKKTTATLLELPFNTGIGSAVQTGLRYAVHHGFSIAIQVDADGQHPPQEIKKLLKALQPHTDLVIGSRFVKKTAYEAQKSRKLGISFFSLLIHVLYRTKIYDPTSGFRVFQKRALKLFAENYPIDFPEPESIVTLLKQRYSLKEVSVKMKERQAGKSSLASIRAYYLLASITLSLILSAFNKNTPSYSPSKKGVS